MERILAYAADGYTPFWMQHNAVRPWTPRDRWGTPSRSDVLPSPEAEWFLWLATIVDRIENERKMLDFSGGGDQTNWYRERILDEAWTEAFGMTNPSKDYAFNSQGGLVARLFSKGAQRRADLFRALLKELQPIIEEHGPKILSGPQLERARAASKPEGCGASQAASAAADPTSAPTPRRKPLSPPRTQRVTLRSRPRTPPTTSGSGLVAAPNRVRQKTRSPVPAPPAYPLAH